MKSEELVCNLQDRRRNDGGATQGRLSDGNDSFRNVDTRRDVDIGFCGRILKSLRGIRMGRLVESGSAKYDPNGFRPILVWDYERAIRFATGIHAHHSSDSPGPTLAFGTPDRV